MISIIMIKIVRLGLLMANAVVTISMNMFLFGVLLWTMVLYQ